MPGMGIHCGPGYSILDMEIIVGQVSASIHRESLVGQATALKVNHSEPDQGVCYLFLGYQRGRRGEERTGRLACLA